MDAQNPARPPDGNPHNGRLVPVYVVTGGRTRASSRDLPLESLVTATDHATWAGDLQEEYRVIIQMAGRAVSLVEIGATLRVPIGVARVLVSDLAASGYLTVHAPEPTTADGRPTQDVLARLLEGLRART
jgi:hypothetical protein